MRCYRICRAAYAALDGEGAGLVGGRWNSPGRAAVYTAGSIALAALEYLVHVDIEDVPDDLVVLTIQLPDDVAVRHLEFGSLHGDSTLPGSRECRALGDAWLSAATEAVLQVPSATVAEESNFIINPHHPAARDITVRHSRKFAFDPRLME